MQNSNRFSYRGYWITTHWVESEPPAGGRAKQFSGNFSVDPVSASELPYQQFPRDLFATAEAAEEHALNSARRSIDLNLAIGGLAPSHFIAPVYTSEQTPHL